MSFPNEREVKLGRILVKYCSDLLSDSRLDDDQSDSVNIAMECLQQAFHIENIPSENQDLLTMVVGEDTVSDEKKVAEEEKMGTAFEDFLLKAKQGGFFKGCEMDTEKYHKRLEMARQKYNDRFPANQIAPLDKRPLTERKADAEKLKKEGNAKLQQQDYKGAIAEYTKAIRLDPENAVYFSNRSAAYAYMKDYNEAIKDGNRAIQRRPEWPKGYMRVASAQDSLGDIKGAISTYKECLAKIDAADPQWNNIHNSIENLERRQNPNAANPLANMANMFGGGAGAGLPGMGGPGGMDFGAMMKNPMMQQMAQQMMSDPNMMDNIGKMMANPEMQKMAADMMGGGGGSAGEGSGLMSLMSNPQKLQEVLTKVYDDPETKEWMETNKEAADILNRLRGGDSSVGMELIQKPDVMVKMKSLLEKHM
jgi:small glutamine-rich tetratricopeptide repeat-containing protein alpha